MSHLDEASPRTPEAEGTAARYAHGPEIAARLTAWLDQARREILSDAGKSAP